MRDVWVGTIHRRDMILDKPSWGKHGDIQCNSRKQAIDAVSGRTWTVQALCPWGTQRSAYGDRRAGRGKMRVPAGWSRGSYTLTVHFFSFLKNVLVPFLFGFGLLTCDLFFAVIASIVTTHPRGG
jgi:hypothetical protein